MTNQFNTEPEEYNGYYIKFAIIITLVMAIAMLIFSYYSFEQYKKNNQILLGKEAKNIQNIISESFNYSNRINSYIGKQIATHGASDLNFILHLFREADKIQNKNSELLSWTSFDWVNSQNLQVVNSKIGIRKNPPSMSDRDYTTSSSKNPWQLQVSIPIFGDPSEMWVIPAGTGITDSSGKFLGIVVVGFNIGELTNKIQKELSNDVSFTILDKNSNVILQSHDNQLRVNSNPYKQNKISDNFTESSGILNDKILIGEIQYQAYQKMAQYPYIILTGFNKNLMKSGFINLVFPYLLGFIVTAIFFLMILYLFKTKITALLIIEKQLTSSLYTSNIARTKIIRAASHDLKNYIFGISGLAKLLLDSKTKNNEDFEIIESINEQSDELGYFVEDLLDTNQNETGIFALGRMTSCNINNLIKRIALLNKNLAIQHQIEIITDLNFSLPELKCDERRMKQIFNNLITNSIKYSSANTIITITSKYLSDNNQIYIEIKDEGIGMSEEEIKMALAGDGENIDKSQLKKEIDSHGIGIPIVKKLVELHNGKFEIKSIKRGGSKFKLYFDLQNSSCDREPKASEEGAKKSLTGKLILLVDDNPVNIKITDAILRRAGCEVHHSKNGVDAISLLDKNNFDLILMDGEMPVMNGYDAAMAIRKGECFKNFKNYKNIPIIALMGNSDHETIGRIQDSQMNGHLFKPSSPKEILDIIEEFLL